MNRLMWASCASAVLLMAACGSKDSSKVTVGAQPSKPAATGPATAEEVAKEMRGDVKCPAKETTAHPAGTPVDDVVGVRPGMPLDEAANFVMCDNPMLVVSEDTSRGFNINTFGQHIRQGFDAKFAEPRVVKSSQQILQDMQNEAMQRGENAYVAPLKPGQARYFVSSMGLPGQEQVMSVAREEYYPDAKLPTVQSVQQALAGKYGEPTLVQTSSSYTYLSWEYDPSGAKITQASPLYSACRINVSPDAATSLSSQCGVTVGATITSTAANPGLAQSLAVSSQNGAADMAVLQNTEAALQQGDAARKAKELSDASKNSAQPKL